MDNSKKVLLVDNDRQFLEILSRELFKHGYRVEEAHDGLEGIEKAVQDPPDIAVVDLIMPRVGGVEVVSFFRQNPYLSSLPIILLSGVLIEDPSVVDSLDVNIVLTKGSTEETTRLVLAGLEKLGNGFRGRKEVTISRDFQARTQVAELLEIKGDLGSVLEGAGAGILELNAAGRVVYANGRAEEILGLDRARFIGNELLWLVPKAGSFEFRTLLFRFKGDTGPVSRAMTFGVEGRVIHTVLTSVWKESTLQSIVVTFSEIPAHVVSETRPVRLAQYLCHEMRSSLLIVEGYLRSLAGKVSDLSRAEHTKKLLFLARETGRLLRLVNDAWEFDRALRELPAVEMEPVDFLDVVKDAISGVTALAADHGIEVNFRPSALVPRVWGNRDKLLQVLYNLLLNSLKFTRPGGSVMVEVEVFGGEIVATVADTGQGIPSEALKEILAQANRPELFLAMKVKRVGLGLAIAVQIVRAHGGRFYAESKVGVGSRFSFALPPWSEEIGQGSPSNKMHPLVETSGD